jgi:hypothetical protein
MALPGSVTMIENDAPPPPLTLPPPPAPPTTVMVAVQPLAGTAHAVPVIEPRATLRPVPVGRAAPPNGDGVTARELVDAGAEVGDGDGDTVDGDAEITGCDAVAGAGELDDVRHDVRMTEPAAPSAVEPPT